MSQKILKTKVGKQYIQELKCALSLNFILYKLLMHKSLYKYKIFYRLSFSLFQTLIIIIIKRM